MLNEELEQNQKRISEMIKNYIKPDLLLKSWNNEGLKVIK